MKTFSRADDWQTVMERVFRRSLRLYILDSGSCNACVSEVLSLFSPVYDIQRFGIDLAASPGQADLIVVTGGLTEGSRAKLLSAFEAVPSPKMVVAVGNSAIAGGIFAGNGVTLSGVDALLPVSVYVPGCPPRPAEILDGILLAARRYEELKTGERSAALDSVAKSLKRWIGGNRAGT